MGAALLKLLDHVFHVGESSAKKHSREKVSPARGNRLTVGDHIELAELTRRAHRIDTEPLSNEGRETRDLGFGALSRGAVNDFNLRIGHDPPRIYRNIASVTENHSACV
ncbi:MAG TPA: hypothetical protein VGR36_06120 [Candidatus Acidoferrales bacterium]|nr:hypothetical protein [Candidatus Acidoferrales bacterium]